MADWLAMIGATVGALLPIANPFSTAPVFAAITLGATRESKKRQARLAGLYMACILLISLIAGALVLEFFGISLPALRIAGGLIIARIGFGMLNPEPDRPLPKRDQEESSSKEDIAFTPIAMPLLSGPGSIAVTISMATSADQDLDYIPIGIGIILVALFSWIVLRSAASIVDRLGRTGVNALTRLMGLLLVCVGVQFVGTGAIELLTTGPAVDAINQAFPEPQ
jgi:multiple antibiotic resistance protein